MRYLLLFLIITAPLVRAATPEDVTREYFALIKTQGMASIARLTHPDELVKFQNMLQPFIDEALTDLEGQAVFKNFAEPSDPGKPKTMSPRLFMEEFLGWAESTIPHLKQALNSSSMTVIGHVMESDVAHVVTRTKVEVNGLVVEQMGVVSTKDHNGIPMMMLSGEIRNLAQVLRASRKR